MCLVSEAKFGHCSLWILNPAYFKLRDRLEGLSNHFSAETFLGSYQVFMMELLCEKSKRQRSSTNFARKLHHRYLVGSWICLCNEESLWIIFMFDVRTVEGQSGIMHLLRMQKLPKNYLLTPDTHTRTCGYRRVGGKKRLFVFRNVLRTYKRNGWCLTSNIPLDIWEYAENLQGCKL